MVSATLAASAGFAFLAATVYVVVGWRLSRRQVSPDAKLAATLFLGWWFSLALFTGLTGVQTTLGALGAVSLPLFLTLVHLGYAVICAGLFCLLYYLLFLFTGRRGFLWPLGALYGLAFALLLYHSHLSDPLGVTVGRWTTTLDYASPRSGPLFNLVVSLVIVPQLLGALAYFSLFRRVRDRTLRFRIALVSWSILVWFGSALVVALGGLGQNDLWQFASRALGLGAALTILVAYEPPAAVRRWLRVGSLSEPVQPAAPSSTAES